MILFLQGASITAALITSLGPQNIEIIRLGLLKQNTLVMASIFILCDVILVIIGAAGIGSWITSQKELLIAAKYITAIMLYYLAYQAIRRMSNPVDILLTHSSDSNRLIKTIQRGLFLSFFNPLVVLETVILVGSASAQYPMDRRIYFILGSLSASFFWFYSMAFCTTKISSLFLLPKRRRILDGCIGVLLGTMATAVLFKTY